MADLLGGMFSQFGGIATIAKYAGWGLLFLIILASIIACVMMLLIKKKQLRVIEIGLMSRKMRIYSGRLKKHPSGMRQFWSGKIKRWLPHFQQKDLYFQGKKDTTILVMDNNGLYHTARVPTFKELQKWYKVVHNIDLTDKDLAKNNKSIQNLLNIYLLPNPHEDLDWLANQCIEAEDEFKGDAWWKHPNVMVIGVALICCIMFIMTIILANKV